MYVCMFFLEGEENVGLSHLFRYVTFIGTWPQLFIEKKMRTQPHIYLPL